jgi:hypothetical protein
VLLGCALGLVPLRRHLPLSSHSPLPPPPLPPLFCPTREQTRRRAGAARRRFALRVLSRNDDFLPRGSDTVVGGTCQLSADWDSRNNIMPANLTSSSPNVMSVSHLPRRLLLSPPISKEVFLFSFLRGAAESDVQQCSRSSSSHLFSVCRHPSCIALAFLSSLQRLYRRHPPTPFSPTLHVVRLSRRALAAAGQPGEISRTFLSSRCRAELSWLWLRCAVASLGPRALCCLALGVVASNLVFVLPSAGRGTRVAFVPNAVNLLTCSVAFAVKSR